ncbi:MAG: glutaminase A [Candidatus Binatia bacterium]
MPATAPRPPASSPIRRYLERVHADLAPVDDGHVASYIPELTKADPSWFGIAVATTDGAVYEVGDTRVPFTIQSISKPLVYGLALEDRGKDSVLKRIGVEPTGDAFNSISLEPATGRPLNPMINAGAITAASLVAGRSATDRYERVLALFSMYAGRLLDLDEAVYLSEKETGHRNRAIGHMLRNFDIINEDPEPALDLYFRQCSIRVDCRDLAVMAATLAAGGTNPVTRESVVSPVIVRDLLSVMSTCGMYDYAGEWVYRVGMPAKSGVGGGILAVLPGRLGIGVFSPRLDARGNSKRGVMACERLSRDWGLHFLTPPRAAMATVRAQYTLASVRSKRRRRTRELEVLGEEGRRGRVVELHGDIDFAAAETVIRTLLSHREPAAFVILDFKRVPDMDAAAIRLLTDLVRTLGADGTRTVLTGVASVHAFVRFAEEQLGAENTSGIRTFAQLDAGMEWCENALLEQAAANRPLDKPCELPAQQICRGMDAEEIDKLATYCERATFARGKTVVRKGDAADRLFLIVMGECSATLDLGNGQQKRLSTISQGMAFGEAGVLAGGLRTADVRADRPLECLVLTRESFDRMGRDDPGLQNAVLRGLLRVSNSITGSLTGEVAALEA